MYPGVGRGETTSTAWKEGRKLELLFLRRRGIIGSDCRREGGCDRLMLVLVNIP